MLNDDADSYDVTEMRLEWFKGTPYELKTEHISLAQFQLKRIKQVPCEEVFSTGTLPRYTKLNNKSQNQSRNRILSMKLKYQL